MVGNTSFTFRLVGTSGLRDRGPGRRSGRLDGRSGLGGGHRRPAEQVPRVKTHAFRQLSMELPETRPSPNR